MSNNLDLVKIDDELFEDIVGNNTKYTPEQRIMAATYYAVTGSSLQAADKCKASGTAIPASTIRKWKNTTSWWKPVLHEVRKAKQEELDAKLTSIIMEGAEKLEDRVRNGNIKLNPKTGELNRIPMTSGELAKDAVGIPYDKRALMRGDPTSRTEKVDPKTMLEELAKQFVKIVELNEPKTIIDAEVVKEDSIEEQFTNELPGVTEANNTEEIQNG
tara:strand:- start:531 stop:1178 length:648 start_codon:yes stop_codon:yes gene_type:complete